MSVGAKFIALTNYLKASGKQTIRLSFGEIETILGFTLSPCKRKHRASWTNCTAESFCCSWLNANYRVKEVNLLSEIVVFEKA